MRAKSRCKAEIRKQIEPLCVAFPLVIADDGEEGNIGFLERSQNLDGALQIDQSRPSVVKEIARVDDGVDIVRDGVLGDAPEGGEKVVSSRGRIVLLVPDVGIARVDNPRHCRSLARGA